MATSSAVDTLKLLVGLPSESVAKWLGYLTGQQKAVQGSEIFFCEVQAWQMFIYHL